MIVLVLLRPRQQAWHPMMNAPCSLRVALLRSFFYDYFSLRIMFFCILLLPHIQPVSLSNPQVSSFSLLLPFMFPPSPPPPSLIRIFYIGSCPDLLPASISDHHAHLVSIVAIQCLEGNHSQIGNCGWFIHADDRDAGRGSACCAFQPFCSSGNTASQVIRFTTTAQMPLWVQIR